MARLKEKLLKHLHQQVYCQLGISKIHGIGVFAIREIPKSCSPLGTLDRKRELKIKREEVEALPKGVRAQLERFCYNNNAAFYVPSWGLNTRDLAVYLNHSKNPNLRFTRSGNLKALKKIRKGQELTIDYDKSFGELHRF